MRQADAQKPYVGNSFTKCLTKETIKTMALKVKAVKKLLKFNKNENDPSVYRYVMAPDKLKSSSGSSMIWCG